ncbi:MAG: hypothetical protein WC124_01535 [Desulfoplanes sp.]|nr:hypothetical protein [Desulfoplanes sp.]
MGTTKSAVSQVVGKLEKKGFALKRPATNNDKEILVFLTSVGKRAFEARKEFDEHHLHSLIERLEEFSDTQIATTAMILSVVKSVADDRMTELFGNRL